MHLHLSRSGHMTPCLIDFQLLGEHTHIAANSEVNPKAENQSLLQGPLYAVPLTPQVFQGP